MDVPRAHRRRRRWIVVVPAALVGLLLVASLGTAAFDRGTPSVPLASIFVDTVTRAPMAREVRGPGALVPERVQFISAVTAGRVDRVHLLPGSVLEPATVLLELANPDVQIEALEADRQLADAEAALLAMRVDLRDRLLEQSGRVEDLRVQARDAARRAAVIETLREEGLSSPHEALELAERSAALASRLGLEEQRLAGMAANLEARIRAQEAQTERLRSIARFQHGRERSMIVRAGVAGVLQDVPLEPGQYAQAGAVLARVIPTPLRLKAVLQIPEAQAGEIVPGLPARIDTRNGIVAGRVTRIDPAASGGTVAVDVALTDSLPAGARPDLQIDGVVEIEAIGEVLQVGRPATARADAAIELFRLEAGGHAAERVRVRVGRLSVGTMEITAGLAPGDRVILSDMSRFGEADRVRLR